ncbi:MULTISPECIES: nickel-responsive transcriptional regulator NikR [Halanaerobium]|jgi:CopG family nickel-responsive transcriptional regulator|uniref:Putative nickel-responsive regulator n=1 Tax=Halanaerobium kushneri TaxID=56779 RepID=A0A1N6Z5J3_9FIRM|nr:MULTISPECIES: nickel-responsive transcriptional regulator NikR [Halanaerobium]RCW62325.1 CopG family transcriptional regulator [Halanaerobium sp. ST460_2HS_T2]SIR22056.1 transcriptional regulator, CopG family [Halanaerobium kushneri]
MSELKRFGVSIEENLLQKFDQLNEGIYNNRSEAIRDLIRNKIIAEENTKKDADVVGTITLIYDHHQTGLTDRMNQLQHDYHCLFKTNLHLHLDRNYCLEVIVVEGLQSKLRKISSKLIALKGVKHGKLTVTKIEGMEN